jgi:hypothetical protein
LHEELGENYASEAVEEVNEVAHSVEENSVITSIPDVCDAGCFFCKEF